MRVLPRILADEDEEVEAPPTHEEVPAKSTRSARLWIAGVAAAAAVPRLLYLFVFSDPENAGIRRYGDVYHHWQIAYLTKEIGLTAPDGPRLWDLKGLDYFWGILHPILMVAVFDVTGSIDIVWDRLVSLVFGVAVVVLVFDICRRYWGLQAGLAAALIASFLPTSVMNDASGMIEPLGVALVLIGLASWPRHGLWSGLALGLATMARAEAWLFSLGMVVAAFFRRAGSLQRIPLVAGFAGAMLVYVKILADKTGNPIYPLWWNFLANAIGKWEFAPVSAAQASVRPVLGVLLVAAAAGLAWSLWKRPASYMFLTFGFGYWVFVAGMLGFTSYLASWVWWMPITRVFAFPYVFAGALLAVVLLWWAPRRLGRGVIPVSWSMVAVAVIASQLAWIPIGQVFAPSESEWVAVKAESVQLGSWYNDGGLYRGHSIAVPDDRPDITYALARFGGVEGKHLVSEMYDPFAYLPSGYGYADHFDAVNTKLDCWLIQSDIRLVAVPNTDPNLALMVQDNPTWFSHIGFMNEAKWDVEGVSAGGLGSCQVARSTAR